jgi:hypothetical protein
VSAVSEETYIELAEAVDRGAEFMDAIDPEWFWIVEPEKLDMSNGYPRNRECGCLLAQYSPLGEYNTDEYRIASWTDEARELGFETNLIREYDVLTELWREAIYDRRAAALERQASFKSREAVL